MYAVCLVKPIKDVLDMFKNLKLFFMTGIFYVELRFSNTAKIITRFSLESRVKLIKKQLKTNNRFSGK